MEDGVRRYHILVTAEECWSGSFLFLVFLSGGLCAVVVERLSLLAVAASRMTIQNGINGSVICALVERNVKSARY